MATVDYFYTHAVVFCRARTNSLLLPPPSSKPDVPTLPPMLRHPATSSVFISSLSLPSSYSNSLVFFSLSYLSILHQGLLFFSIRGKLIKCNLLNAQSRAYIVSPSTPCSPHRNYPLMLNFFLYIMPSPLLCYFLCLQLCQKVSLCLPPSYSFSSLYI